MEVWTVILITWAGITMTAFALVLVWFTTSCYRVWEQADGVEGFFRIAVRAVVGTVVYEVIAALQLGVFFTMAALLSMGPELASKLDVPGRLAFGTAELTFLLGTLGGLNLPSAVIVVLASFYVLGLVTMLPGLGYGSKVLWGIIGVIGYAAYLLVGIVITQAFSFWSIVLIPASIMAAGGIRWVSLKILLSVAADAASHKARLESARHFADTP